MSSTAARAVKTTTAMNADTTDARMMRGHNIGNIPTVIMMAIVIPITTREYVTASITAPVLDIYRLVQSIVISNWEEEQVLFICPPSVLVMMSRRSPR